MRIGIGLMTGTSCDGLDCSIVEFSENKRLVLEKPIFFKSYPFPLDLRAALRNAQGGKLDAISLFEVNLKYSQFLGTQVSRIVRKLKLSPRKTFLAVHGQTVWHQPPVRNRQGYSVQLLDPAILRKETGLTVISSFRQLDMALNGHGAPMVPYYHYLRARSLKVKEPFVMLNVGGIANATYVGKSEKSVIAFDSGPGNVLIDLATESATKGRLKFDAGGKLAERYLDYAYSKKGVLAKVLRETHYFHEKPPKSTGRELFNEEFLVKIPGTGKKQIACATLFTAMTVADGLFQFFNDGFSRIYVAGGGSKNPFLMKLLLKEVSIRSQKKVSVEVLPDWFSPAQALESIAFARFGYEILKGRKTCLKNVTGAKSDSGGASIFPGDNFFELIR
ncbi:MAG: anhydro-N-acetylmuramic acid kinase [Bacteriovoracia bacterium]